jgi:hypothetical protein
MQRRREHAAKKEAPAGDPGARRAVVRPPAPLIGRGH